jgi:hypothetical protein
VFYLLTLLLNQRNFAYTKRCKQCQNEKNQKK